MVMITAIELFGELNALVYATLYDSLEEDVKSEIDMLVACLLKESGYEDDCLRSDELSDYICRMIYSSERQMLLINAVNDNGPSNEEKEKIDCSIALQIEKIEENIYGINLAMSLLGAGSSDFKV
jgi:hypothetical protein